MKKIIIDFEINYLPENTEREIIEIGAVMLSPFNQVVSEFHRYVKPSYRLNEKISKLTGIASKDLETAEPLSVVLSSFFEWNRNVNEGYSIYSWSMADYDQLLNETNNKNIQNENIKTALASWHDYQKEFGDLINYSGCLSLKARIISGVRWFQW